MFLRYDVVDERDLVEAPNSGILSEQERKRLVTGTVRWQSRRKPAAERWAVLEISSEFGVAPVVDVEPLCLRNGQHEDWLPK